MPWFAISSAVPARPDAEEQPPPGQEVDAGHLLRAQDRVALDDQADPGADPQPLGGQRGGRAAHEEVDASGSTGAAARRPGGRATRGSSGCGCARGRRATRSHAPRRRRASVIGRDRLVGGEHGQAELHRIASSLGIGGAYGRSAGHLLERGWLRPALAALHGVHERRRRGRSGAWARRAPARARPRRRSPRRPR